METQELEVRYIDKKLLSQMLTRLFNKNWELEVCRSKHPMIQNIMH